MYMSAAVHMTRIFAEGTLPSVVHIYHLSDA